MSYKTYDNIPLLYSKEIVLEGDNEYISIAQNNISSSNGVLAVSCILSSSILQSTQLTSSNVTISNIVSSSILQSTQLTSSQITTTRILLNSGGGIDFSAFGSAGGMTSELLNDYEEGTWTPGLGGGGSGFTVFSGGGHYVKAGKLVIANARIQITDGTGTSAAVTITGLPFTVTTTNNANPVAAVFFRGLAFAYSYIIGYVASGTSITLQGVSGTAVGMVNIPGTNLAIGSDLSISLVYRSSS